VVAHPERARPGAATSAAIEREIAAGSVLQLTAWSLTGEYGEDVRALAWRLLRRAPRVVIASDAHSLERPPWLRPATAALAAGGMPNPARFVSAAGALLESGLAIPPSELVA
jgi:protein-tyrosine phosphatase